MRRTECSHVPLSSLDLLLGCHTCDNSVCWITESVKCCWDRFHEPVFDSSTLRRLYTVRLMFLASWMNQEKASANSISVSRTIHSNESFVFLACNAYCCEGSLFTLQRVIRDVSPIVHSIELAILYISVCNTVVSIMGFCSFVSIFLLSSYSEGFDAYEKPMHK